MGEGGRRRGISPYRPKFMAACTFNSLSRFRPSLTGLCNACWGGVCSHGWDDMEFASRSSVDWRGSHQWAITCSIGVQLFAHSDAPQKCNIYATFDNVNEHDPWRSVTHRKNTCSKIYTSAPLSALKFIPTNKQENWNLLYEEALPTVRVPAAKSVQVLLCQPWNLFSQTNRKSTVYCTKKCYAY